MKLITFATFKEAETTLALFKATQIDKNLYSCPIGHILITGVGSFAAYISIKRHPHPFDELIHLGIAGALNRTLTLGTIHPVAEALKLSWKPADNSLETSFEPISLCEKGLSLGTVDFPLYQSHSTPCDLIDMEGYALALGAHERTKKCSLYKLVSDFCTKETSSQIKNNISKYSEQLAHFLINNKGA